MQIPFKPLNQIHDEGGNSKFTSCFLLYFDNLLWNHFSEFWVSCFLNSCFIFVIWIGKSYFILVKQVLYELCFCLFVYVGKEVAKIFTQVSVTKREAEIKLDHNDFEERKQINKRKKLILEGKDPDEEERRKVEEQKQRRKTFKRYEKNKFKQRRKEIKKFVEENSVKKIDTVKS